MPRIYVSNESYPELREIESRWAQTRTWARAFGSAVRDARFWRFPLGLALQWGFWWLIWRQSLHLTGAEGWGADAIGWSCLALAVAGHSLLTVTWGGDLIRPHLRRVSDRARAACPCCGYQLTSQLLEATERLGCPECGESIPRSTFAPPYPIPRAYRAWAGSSRRRIQVTHSES